MAETRVPDSDYAIVAHRLIDEDERLALIKGSEVRIAYLASDFKKTSHGRPVLGQCEKVPARFRWCVPFDFTITVFQPNVEGLDDGQVRTLLLHELMHLGISYGEDGESYSIVHHDVQDFRAIVEEFGFDWAVPGGAAS